MAISLNEEGLTPASQVLAPGDGAGARNSIRASLGAPGPIPGHLRRLRKAIRRAHARRLCASPRSNAARRRPLRADPDLVWRIEQFYGAIELVVEQETGLVASPMLKIYDEGFGRVILITGKLVVLTKHLRDAQRFGFETLAALAAEGMKQVAAAVAMIRQFPEVARA